VNEFLDIRGRTVAVSRVGSGSRLICLPGGPGFAGDHLGDLGGLATDHELVRLDWRGAGSSEPPADGRHGVADYATDLAVVHDALGLERIDLFGHSFGGLVAVQYAATYPDRVARLVLDGTPDRLDDGRAPVDGPAGYFATFDDAARAYLESITASLYEPAAAWFAEHELTQVDLRPILGAITARTLVVTGAQDWAAGSECAMAMAAAIPDAEVAVIPDAGHFAWREQPHAYATAIRDFLA
jgi:proline iminopeptidase